MKKLVAAPSNEKLISSLKVQDLERNILASVYKGTIKIFGHYYEQYDNKIRVGFIGYKNIHNVNWGTDTAEKFLERLNTEHTETSEEEFYLFESLPELARAIVHNGWK
jgi:hypothetical protein